jgi:hypothetical protein
VGLLAHGGVQRGFVRLCADMLRMPWRSALKSALREDRPLPILLDIPDRQLRGRQCPHRSQALTGIVGSPRRLAIETKSDDCPEPVSRQPIKDAPILI